METVLAMVLGGMVLMGCLGVFFALRNMETTFSTRFERTSELDITHTVMSRAMLSLQMEETPTNQITRAPTNEGADENDGITELEPESRFRMILETDPTALPDSTGWVPQRLELVNATPPVPSGLATQAAGWYVAQDQSESLDFSAMDGSQGIMRGVFELRPSGERERIMHRLGLINTNDPILDDIDDINSSNTIRPVTYNPNLQSEIRPSWTLWWRPILSYEGEQLLYGQGPYPDTIGSPEEIRARLSGAVPLMRNIERCIWEVFKGDEFVDTHYGLTMGDLPAYAQFEVVLTNSQYASWMFEVDWVLGDDPSTSASSGADGDDGTGNDADDGNNGTNGRPGSGDDNGRPGRPGGGQIDPNATRTVDFNGDS